MFRVYHVSVRILQPKDVRAEKFLVYIFKVSGSDSRIKSKLNVTQTIIFYEFNDT